MQGGEILSSSAEEDAPSPPWPEKDRILLETTLRPFFNDIWYKDDMSTHTTKLMHRFVPARSMIEVAAGIESWMNSRYFEPYLARLPDSRREHRSLLERLARRKRIDAALCELMECCHQLGVEMSWHTPLPVRRVRRECTKKRTRADAFANDEDDMYVMKRPRLEVM
jgi:hypothetical protein